MNINESSIELIKKLEKEYMPLPPSVYFNFAPIKQGLDKGRFLKTELRRKDTHGYIKHKYRNLWLYGSKFYNLQCNKYGFDWLQPTVCWIGYLREPTFFIWRPIDIKITDRLYLNYKEIVPNNDITKDKEIIITWTPHVHEATIFSWDIITWSSTLSENKHVI